MGPYLKLMSSAIRLRTFWSLHTLLCVHNKLNPIEISGSFEPTTEKNEVFIEHSIPLKSISVEPGHVYFVATPIGNMYDISKRATDTLSDADMICAEDTRHARHLLNLLGVGSKKIISHHEHNYLEQIPYIIQLAREGKSVAVVSDAGTPGISDPGAQLADACFKNNIPVHPIPGPSAVVTALSIAGYASTQFTFYGFTPVKGKERASTLRNVVSNPQTCVMFEAPHRIVDTLTELSETYKLSQRPCVCCREITKIHEEFIRGTVADCLARLRQREQGTDPNNAARIRGEFTLVLGPWTGADGSAEDESAKISRLLTELCADGVYRSEAVKLVTEMAGAAKSAVYKRALEIPWPKNSKDE